MPDKTNLELKHFCDDFGKIRTVLKEIGATHFVTKTQKDYFFNLPKTDSGARLKFRIEDDAQTLVHYTRPAFSGDKETASKVKLYFVQDKELLPFLQHALGVPAVVDKKREVWKKGDTVFHLDTIKNVGKVFEVEMQKTGKVTVQDRKLFREYQNELIPHLGKVIRGSNIDLVLKK